MSQVYKAADHATSDGNSTTIISQAFLDYEGVKHLWSKVSLNDYPNNETLVAIISAIDETKADKSEIPSLNNYYNKTEIDNLELITISDIDTICGASLVAANEVTY